MIFILSMLMCASVFLVRSFLYLFLNPERKFQAFLIISLSVSAGVATYGWLGLKTRLADKLLGEKVSKIRKKLKIK